MARRPLNPRAGDKLVGYDVMGAEHAAAQRRAQRLAVVSVLAAVVDYGVLVYLIGWILGRLPSAGGWSLLVVWFLAAATAIGSGCGAKRTLPWMPGERLGLATVGIILGAVSVGLVGILGGVLLRSVGN